MITIQVFDLIEVQDSLGMSNVKIEKVTDITRDYYITKDHRYSKRNLCCLTRGRESYKIIGVQPNLKRKIYGFCNDKKFIPKLIDSQIYLAELIHDNTVVEIAYYNLNKRLNIEINSIRVFAGTVTSIEDFKTIYKCVIDSVL